jgi:hypothetical protein
MAHRSLWAVLVGGTVPGIRLEVHDLLFTVGETIEDCVPALRAGWRGEPASLHLDAWGRLDAADGHRLALTDTPPEGPRLWFVHTGGYDRQSFTEHHGNHFVVAESREEAKRRAVMQHREWTLPHKDAIGLVDAVEELTEAAGGGVYVVPTPEAGAAFRFEADYRSIG